MLSTATSAIIARPRRYRTLNSANYCDRVEELFQKNHLGFADERQMEGFAYETFGPEMDYIRELYKTAPERIVTVISGASGAWWVSNGFHYVDRNFYLVAKEGVALPDFKDFRY